MTTRKQFLATAVIGLLCASQVSAQTVIVDNTAEPVHVTSPVAVNFSSWEANKFTTDANTYSLQSITLNLDDALDTSGAFVVELHSDNSGTPGSFIAALSGSVNPATAGLYTYTPSSTVTLNPNTPYWVVAMVSSGNGDYGWHFTSSTSQAPGAVGTVGGFSESLDQGASWSAEDTSFPSEFKVVGVVPEPSTYAAVFGLVALGF